MTVWQIDEEPPYLEDPCMRLLFAMVERAISDALGYEAKNREEEKRRALRWIYSRSKKPFSLLWILGQASDYPEECQKNIHNLLERWDSRMTSRAACAADFLFAVQEGILKGPITISKDYTERRLKHQAQLSYQRNRKRCGTLINKLFKRR